ncbi:MAG: AMP-binding protein [Oscillospiraceae bacterium]|jgi:acetyl-CoA synthetase|nr:AMP-binding protein [Oscillospiraceae bacterium]
MSETAERELLEQKLKEVSVRIRELRGIEGLSEAEMAEKTGVTPEEYRACESGRENLSFAFIYRCAIALGVDVTDIIEGASPRLTSYTVTRAGDGQRIERAHNMIYYSLAHAFRGRRTEPLRVTAIYDDALQDREIEVTTHDGQECDIVISGELKVRIGEHTETLRPGDCVYYDSATPHGMIAVGGADCEFYAIVIDPVTAPELPGPREAASPRLAGVRHTGRERVYKKYIDTVEDENGTLQSISFKNTESFNFAFDVVDAIAAREPDKLALLHIAKDKTERRLTFEDISRLSSRAANYFTSLGIKRGDRVMLVLRRNWQFWIATVALEKIGAISIPATDQLLEKDYKYRIDAAGVTAVMITAESELAPREAESAVSQCPGVAVKIACSGAVPGWRDFDGEFEKFRSAYPREADAPCGDDFMLMYFTSGTSGYPKIAAHNYKYPLGHFITAKYWQCVDADGLHLTISDTGWAKSAWGKIYGQWLSEAPLFAYDFDRFDPGDILPMFAKYGITTFCAPPTMYRFLIREDLSKFDMSSIKHATIAGEALNPEVFHQFRKHTGLSLMEGFGQSESSVLIGNIAGMTPKPGSMGRPTPLYDIDLVDADNNPVPDGEVGEIVVRTSPGLTPGLVIEYYNDPENTANVWRGGVYHTGDTAWRDEEGYYWYVGRVDDLIKSSGYRIGPFEIESVIMELPYVLECGVSAVPDEIRGQIVKASVVLKGREPSDELAREIQSYVKEHTAPYKYPRVVVFRDALPKTVSGKIQRNLL